MNGGYSNGLKVRIFPTLCHVLFDYLLVSRHDYAHQGRAADHFAFMVSFDQKRKIMA
jgi:hypothetical protein